MIRKELFEPRKKDVVEQLWIDMSGSDPRTLLTEAIIKAATAIRLGLKRLSEEKNADRA